LRHLIRYVALRHLTASPGRTFLTVFGVVLGVALVFAIDLVNGSVMASFRRNIDRLAGKTALILGDGTGVDEELLEVIRGVPGVELASPVIQDSVRDIARATQLAVMAVDSLADNGETDAEQSRGTVQIPDEVAFLNDPRAIVLSRSYAKKHGLALGSVLELETLHGPAKFTVRGLLSPDGAAKVFGGDLAMMDVYAAQIAFERGRRFDRVDVIPRPNQDIESLARSLRAAVAERVAVTRPQQRARDAEQILAGFNLGLTVASLLAILVGAFIVYNAIAISVAQRRKEIGILRALGATRRQVVTLFVGEGLLIGLIGSALGVPLGLALGHAALSTVSASISELYVPVRVDELFVSAAQLGLAVALGASSAFLAALLPARRAAHVEPSAAMRKSVESRDLGFSSARGALLASLLMTLLAVAFAYGARTRQDFVLGTGAALCLALATAFLAPALVRCTAWLARRLTSRRAPAVRLGVLSFERNGARNAIAVAALSLALGNVVNIGCFLESIKQNTVTWFERTLRADILVFAGMKVQGKFEHPLPGSMLGELAAMPGVEFVNPLRMTQHSFRDRAFYLFAYDLPKYSQYDEVPVVEGDLKGALEEIARGEGLAASETFAKEFGIALGDSITLQTAAGPRAFRISLIYVDYSAELGILTTTREVYVRLWGDSLIDWFGLYLRPGTPALPLRERIARELGARHQLMVLGNAEYKAEAVGLFDKSFALMRAMELVAIAIALLGIVNTLVVSVIDRTVELGILKAIGAVGRQVRTMFVTEAMLIGVTSALLGVAGGAALSLFTVKEMLRLQMGWQIPWEGSPSVVLETVIVAQLVALVAAWLPARTAAKLDVVQALAYE
jgi:putative ABC transport system permease protein